MNMKELHVWVHASVLAVGVSLDANGTIIEDACWLQLIKNTQHINMVELDAILRGINLTLKKQVTVLYLNTDSLCIHHWVTNALMRMSHLNTKSASEMLIRQ